jgi:superfamily I DNA/RNA helicase
MEGCGEVADRIADAHFADSLERELVHRDIPAFWLARDYTTRSTYDISNPQVIICTIHSAKGLDFDTVILVGVDTLGVGTDLSDVAAASLLFTGITRARERLIIPYFLEKGWVPGMAMALQSLARNS